MASNIQAKGEMMDVESSDSEKITSMQQVILRQTKQLEKLSEAMVIVADKDFLSYPFKYMSELTDAIVIGRKVMETKEVRR